MTNQSKNTKQRTQRLAMMAMFVALILLLGLTPLGLIPLGFVYATILCVPVIIGVLSMDQKSGLILGLAFGLVSLYTAITKPSGLVAPLVQSSIPLTALMCIVPRLCVPVVALKVYNWLSKKSDEQAADSASMVFGTLLAAVVGLIMVLVLFLSGTVRLPDGGNTFGYLWTKNQLLLLLGCIVFLFAMIGALVSSFLTSKVFRNTIVRHTPSTVAAICGSLTNTVLYLGLMLLFYVMCGIDATGVLAMIGGIALIAGLSEAILAAILVPPILTAVKKIRLH